MTPTQADIVNQCRAEYGEPDRLSINEGSIYLGAAVIVRMTWWKQQRELFVLPNGDRLNWREVSLWP